MPNNVDFSLLINLKKVKLEPAPEGWNSPLFIEYGMGEHGSTLSYFWRVNGTEHTFVIPIARMQYLSAGNYEGHFKEVLKAFREDYIEWAKEEFYTQWMQEYKEQFNEFIKL